jgi:hypothetical protein
MAMQQALRFHNNIKIFLKHHDYIIYCWAERKGESGVFPFGQNKKYHPSEIPHFVLLPCHFYPPQADCFRAASRRSPPDEDGLPFELPTKSPILKSIAYKKLILKSLH